MALISGLMSTSKELLELDTMFKQFDKDNNGTLSQQELEEGMTQVIGQFQADITNWDQFFEAIDANHDGEIDYNEFITASIDRAKVMNKTNIDNVFRIFDANGDGFIDLDELKDVFQGKLELTDRKD